MLKKLLGRMNLGRDAVMFYTSQRKTSFLKVTISAIVMIILLVPQVGISKPEKIKPGVIYYSDETEEVDGIEDLIGEKNFEEVYRNYTYFEAVYDQQKRISILKEFERGELIRTVRFQYHSDGRLLKKTESTP